MLDVSRPSSREGRPSVRRARTRIADNFHGAGLAIRENCIPLATSNDDEAYADEMVHEDVPYASARRLQEMQRAGMVEAREYHQWQQQQQYQREWQDPSLDEQWGRPRSRSLHATRRINPRAATDYNTSAGTRHRDCSRSRTVSFRHPPEQYGEYGVEHSRYDDSGTSFADDRSMSSYGRPIQVPTQRNRARRPISLEDSFDASCSLRDSASEHRPSYQTPLAQPDHLLAGTVRNSDGEHRPFYKQPLEVEPHLIGGAVRANVIDEVEERTRRSSTNDRYLARPHDHFRASNPLPVFGSCTRDKDVKRATDGKPRSTHVPRNNITMSGVYVIPKKFSPSIRTFDTPSHLTIGSMRNRSTAFEPEPTFRDTTHRPRDTLNNSGATINTSAETEALLSRPRTPGSHRETDLYQRYHHDHMPQYRRRVSTHRPRDNLMHSGLLDASDDHYYSAQQNSRPESAYASPLDGSEASSTHDLTDPTLYDTPQSKDAATVQRRNLPGTPRRGSIRRVSTSGSLKDPLDKDTDSRSAPVKRRGEIRRSANTGVRREQATYSNEYAKHTRVVATVSVDGRGCFTPNRRPSSRHRPRDNLQYGASLRKGSKCTDIILY